MLEDSKPSSDPDDRAERPVKPFLACLTDLGLLALAYAAITCLDLKNWPGLSPQLKLGAVFGLIWLISILLTRKCSRVFELPLRAALAKLTWSTGIMGLLVSIILIILGLTGFSQAYLFGTVGLYYLLELALFGAWVIRLKRRGLFPAEDQDQTRTGTSLILPLAGLDFALLVGVYLAVYFLKRGSLDLSPDYLNLLLIMIGVWTATSWLTRKFFKQVLPNFLSAVEICFKSAFLMAGFMAALVFGCQLFFYSREQIFGTILAVTILEPILYGLYFAFRSTRSQKEDIESRAKVRDLMAQDDYQLTDNSPGQGDIPEKPARSSLQSGLELIQPWLFEFIDQNLDLKRINKDLTRIVSNDDHLSLETLVGNKKLCFLLNLHQTNDQRFINRYFLEVHRLLKEGGYLVGKAKTYRNIRARFKRKYSKNLAYGLGVLHFVLHRVLPKLPVTKQVYFALTKGRNRAISKAEVLGRLSFCGFQIVSALDFDDFLYFIARKTSQPSDVSDPTYGPLITLKRAGTKGQPILVYKFRTMHPYSEFLQDYMYKLNKLSPGGKMANDFRVTEWGRIMRKLWLDELPMLYNWLRGDLQLIGIRPLSWHFFSLYPKRLQKLRQETKPGLLPPFYADMPKTLDEICSSEEKYLQSYLSSPLKTQCRYFFLTIYNIVIRGARSG